MTARNLLDPLEAARERLGRPVFGAQSPTDVRLDVVIAQLDALISLVRSLSVGEPGPHPAVRAAGGHGAAGAVEDDAPHPRRRTPPKKG